MAQNNAVTALVFAAIGAAAFVSFGLGDKPQKAIDPQTPLMTGKASMSQRRIVSPPKQFAGYDCTEDCSGHIAGYRWAEEHGIADEEDCDAAGEHSNSPSFSEGCQAYVDGDVVDDDDATVSDEPDDDMTVTDDADDGAAASDPD